MTPEEEARTLREAAAILRKYSWRNERECHDVWAMGDAILEINQ